MSSNWRTNRRTRKPFYRLGGGAKYAREYIQKSGIKPVPMVVHSGKRIRVKNGLLKEMGRDGKWYSYVLGQTVYVPPCDVFGCRVKEFPHIHTIRDVDTAVHELTHLFQKQNYPPEAIRELTIITPSPTESYWQYWENPLELEARSYARSFVESKYEDIGRHYEELAREYENNPATIVKRAAYEALKRAVKEQEGIDIEKDEEEES